MESRRVSPVFVGRASELAELAAGLARAGRGEPQAYVIGGEAGIGKSRLLDEVLAAARAAGAVTAVGFCVELGADGLPFAPVAAILRSLHRQLGPELAAAVTGREGELARLLPELGEARGASGDALDRMRLFELTARMLERLAADRPLVVAVEDLHWSDRSTRELLGYLFRSVQRSRLVILATYRADDLHRRHPLRPFLAELDRLRSVRRVELARLSDAEVVAQMAGITGGAPEPALARSVFERSEGNPFFVEELTASGGGRGLSESLRDLLLVRVEALSEGVQELLRIVAEAGSSVEHALLAEVARLPEPELLAALRAAVGGCLLVPTEDGDGYRFRHALMREAVVDDLLPGERARLNRRFAKALEAGHGLVPESERAARLASYWFHAGDGAKALPAVLAAAGEAGRRYAHAERLRLLERGLELWDTVPEPVRAGLRPVEPIWAYPEPHTPGRPMDYPDLLAEATMAAVLSEEKDRVLALSRRAVRVLDERADPLRAAWFWLQRSRARAGLGRYDGAAELDRARELVQGLPPSVVHAQILAQVAARSTLEMPGPELFATAEHAVRMARLVGAEQTELYARLTLGCVMTDSGDVAAGLAEMSAVIERLIEAGNIGLMSRSLVNFAATLAEVGELERSCQAVARGMDIAHRFGLEDTKGWLSANQAQVWIAMGRWPEAEAAAAAALRQARDVRPRASARLAAGHLARLRGDIEAAGEALATTRAEIDTPDLNPSMVVNLARLEVGVAASRGRIEDVRTALAAAVRIGFPPFTAYHAWEVFLAAAMAESEGRGLPAADPGRPAAVAAIRRAMAPTPRARPMWAALGRLVDVELKRAEGQDTPHLWADVLAALEPFGLPHHLAVARLGWAEALLAEGGPEARERAVEPLRRAGETALALGAAPLRERVARLAARAGLSPLPPAPPQPAEPPDPADAFGLTRRERDVLALVALGRSNRQIAEELFISPKTASVHVSNIMAKLSVSGRGEAAALAHRLRLVPLPVEG
ncbi:helix-turn-helix transcriptional regulator [Streptomyces hainanensis]|uniref:helix-turn-helix transcriptional regulator n=1 Tax=Streptomyces hainanensis TaxID=402648 RepID=UPI0024415ACB|nr:helix-turn-helix transcriptional regulator [Streptomyces hainanensis]